MVLITFPQSDNEIFSSARKYISLVSEGQLEVNTPPEIYQVEWTNKCNYSCKMCPRGKMTRDQGYMQRSLFSNILRYMSSALESPLTELSGFGEPTVHTGARNYTKRATDHGVRLILMTNGTRPSVMMGMVDCGLSAVCIDLTSTQSYLTFKGGDIDKVTAGVEDFLEHARGKLRVELQFVKVPHIIGEQAHTKELAEFIITWSYLMNEDWFKLSVKDFDNFGGSVEGARASPPVPCIVPWQSMTIHWDGKVVPCCRDYDDFEVMGEVRGENSILSVWNSQRYKNFRRMHLKGAFPKGHMCELCSVRGAWNGYMSPFVDLSSQLPKFGEVDVK